VGPNSCECKWYIEYMLGCAFYLPLSISSRKMRLHPSRCIGSVFYHTTRTFYYDWYFPPVHYLIAVGPSACKCEWDIDCMIDCAFYILLSISRKMRLHPLGLIGSVFDYTTLIVYYDWYLLSSDKGYWLLWDPMLANACETSTACLAVPFMYHCPSVERSGSIPCLLCTYIHE
jgi:hypothetical protein